MILIPGGGTARLRQRFRDQFTPTASGYLYRRASQGAALPLSRQDHDDLVAGFDRSLSRLRWGGVLGAMLVFGLLQWSEPRWPAWLRPYDVWVVALPYVAFLAALIRFAWNAPGRVLDGRAPVARALTGREARANGLRTMPWRLPVVGALVSVLLGVRVLIDPDPFGPANRGYLAFAAVLLVAFAALTAAKRRAG